MNVSFCQKNADSLTEQENSVSVTEIGVWGFRQNPKVMDGQISENSRQFPKKFNGA
ncbi:hypothetical protein CKA32_003393 [Geitlerinema sp. FC II]|nr:hypothetical protein CKA32_003393 [Geitlerinema sp. FC II]